MTFCKDVLRIGFRVRLQLQGPSKYEITYFLARSGHIISLMES